MSIEDVISEIEKKREILQDALSKSDMNLKNTEVLEISRELDILIAKYICEIKAGTTKNV